MLSVKYWLLGFKVDCSKVNSIIHATFLLPFGSSWISFLHHSGSKVCAQHRLRQPHSTPDYKVLLTQHRSMHLTCFHSSMPSFSRLLAASFSANKATGNKFVRNQCASRGFECFLNPSNAFQQRSTHCKVSQCSKSQAASSVHMLMFGCCKRT